MVKILQINAVQQIHGAPCNVYGAMALRPHHGHHDIFECRKGVKQVMVLEHKSYGMSAQARQFLVAQLSGFFAIDGKLALSGPIQKPNDVEQGALA